MPIAPTSCTSISSRRRTSPAFLEQARVIIPRHQLDLLNVTVRNILEDKDTFLRYADQDMFSFVMLFNQPRTGDGGISNGSCDSGIDRCRHRLPRALLPAVPIARDKATNRRGPIPQATAFFERKRHFDPDEIFQNQFYVKYGQPRAATTTPPAPAAVR